MLTYLGNKQNIPNLNSIVLGGHSLGGQTVNRYAAIGQSLNVQVPIRYWIGNPDSWLWFNSSRPVESNPGGVCADYDNWRKAFASPPSYNTVLTSQGDAPGLTNFRSKSKIYAKGTLDLGDDKSGCGPFTTGQTRHERFYAQLQRFPPT